MERYITLRNALLCLTIIVFLVAWNRGIILLYGMLAMLVATLVIAYLAPLLMLRGVTVKQSALQKCYEGDELCVTLQVTNTNRFNRYMIEVWNYFPGGLEGEKDHMAFVPNLKKDFTSHMKYICDYRGLHTLGPIRLRSEFPMGINYAQIILESSEMTTLVYPSVFQIHSFPYISGDYTPQLGVNAVSMAGGSDVFFGVREYRHGDSPRHIHWASSARHNTLIVKEFEYTTATEVTLLLDLHENANHGEGKHSTLEYSVKIAASIARHVLDQGHHVRLLGYGKESIHVKASSGELHYQTILEALARVQADGEIPYKIAINNALAHVHDSGVMVLFDVPSLDNKNQINYLELEQQHVMPVKVEFNSDSFIHPVQLEKGGAFRVNGNHPVYPVYRGDDLERIFSSL